MATDASTPLYPVGSYVWVKQEGYPWWPGEVADVAELRRKGEDIPPMPEYLGAQGMAVVCFPTDGSSLVFVNRTDASEVLPFLGRGRGSGKGRGDPPPLIAEGITDTEEAKRVEEGLADPECAPAVKEALEKMWRSADLKKESTRADALQPSHENSAAAARKKEVASIFSDDFFEKLVYVMDEQSKKERKGNRGEETREEEEEDRLLLTLDTSSTAKSAQEKHKNALQDSVERHPPSTRRRKRKRDETKTRAKMETRRTRERKEGKKEKRRREEERRARQERKGKEEEEEEETTSSDSDSSDSEEDEDMLGQDMNRVFRSPHTAKPSSSPPTSSLPSPSSSSSFFHTRRHVASNEELLRYSQAIKSSILFFKEHRQLLFSHSGKRTKAPIEGSLSSPPPSSSSSSSRAIPLSVAPFSSPSSLSSAVTSSEPLAPPTEEGREEEMAEGEAEEANLLHYLRAIAQCDVRMEQLHQLGIGQVVGYLLQSFFPPRVQVLAKAILEYWFASLETTTKELLLDTADVGNCSVESTIGDGEEEEDRGLGDAQMKNMSSLEVILYCNFMVGFDEELETFIKKEPLASMPSAICHSLPYPVPGQPTDDALSGFQTQEGEGNQKESHRTKEKEEKKGDSTTDSEPSEEETRMTPVVEEAQLQALCASLEVALLACPDVDVRMAVLHRLSDEKPLRNALLQGTVTAEEVVKKEEEVALGVASPLYAMNSPYSPLFSPSSGEGSPTSFGATTLYQCPSCGERNAFRSMYTVSAHDNFPTLLNCRSCGQTWSI